MSSNPGMEQLGIGAQPIGAFLLMYNPATNSYEIQRTPTKYKTALVTASGNTAIWTPSAGKKFRLLGYVAQVTGNSILGTAAVVDCDFREGNTSIGHAFSAFIPLLSLGSLGGAPPIPYNFPGNGYLATTADAVLNLNLSSALTGGGIRVSVFGTEE